jgi:hypothetical protein
MVACHATMVEANRKESQDRLSIKSFILGGTVFFQP